MNYFLKQTLLILSVLGFCTYLFPLSPASQKISSFEIELSAWKSLSENNADKALSILSNLDGNPRIYCVNFSGTPLINHPANVTLLKSSDLGGWLVSDRAKVFEPIDNRKEVRELYSVLLYLLVENLTQHACSGISFIVIREARDKTGKYIEFTTIDQGKGFDQSLMLYLGERLRLSGKGAGQGFPNMLSYSDTLSVQSKGLLWFQGMNNVIHITSSPHKYNGSFITAKVWMKPSLRLKKSVQRWFSNYLYERMQQTIKLKRRIDFAA